MIDISLKQLCQIVGGDCRENLDLLIHRISTDSRNIQPGDLFVALKGDHFDGHNYVSQAAALGASAALVSTPVAAAIPQIRVADTLQGLGHIGQWVKTQANVKTVAITGSSGKTTVKELIAVILAQHHQVLATQGNLNNQIGVPLTLLRLLPNHEYGVLELGANHKGEIAYTSALVEPDVALITNIGAAHLEGFGSEQGIAVAKSEIFSGLKAGGTAIYELTTPYASQWYSLLQHKKVLCWSAEGDPKADLAAMEIQSGTEYSSFSLRIGQQSFKVNLPMPGLHNVKNALAAASACHALGLSAEAICTGLALGVQVPGRLEAYQLTPELQVIDDSYNANLGSVKAAIDVLASGEQAKTALIFGDMGELGTYAIEHHKQVGEYAGKQGIDALFCLGELSAHTLQAFSGEGHHSLQFDELMSQLTHWISTQNKPLRLLIKGSRSSAMERVLKGLKQWQMAKEDTPC